MKKKILITGSAGFIFSNFMRKVIDEQWQHDFVSIDRVYESYNRHNIIANRNHQFYLGDISDELLMDNIFSIEKPDIIIHGAAFSFVDASINSAKEFIQNNVVGTQVMVDMAVKYKTERFVYISTDEVLGHLKPGDLSWTEDAPLAPRNPYSASKAAAELIVKAAHETHGLSYNITRCSNNFGKLQPSRNLVPKIIYCLLNDKEISIHGTGLQLREWIFVEDHNSAVMKIIDSAPLNETYNIGSGVELTNLEMVEAISKFMKKTPKIKHVEDRKGHDFRYSVNCDKIKKLGWKPAHTFEEGLKKCVDWYLNNPWYFESIK